MSKILETKIGKLKLDNPVLSASGTFGYGEEISKFFDINKLGAIITKTLTIDKRQGNPSPRIVETPSGMLNSIGLEGPGLEVFLKEKKEFLSKLKTPVIISIAGNSVEDFTTMVSLLDQTKYVKAIEVNLSCPNVAHGVKKGKYKLVAQDAKATEKIIKAIRKKTKKTIITKLSPNVTDITEIAKSAETAGTDAISAINTLLGMAVDIESKKPLLGNVFGGLSGPAIKPVALKMVHDIYKKVKIPIIAIGGISCFKDVIEFMLCGATAVQIGTATFVDPLASFNIIKDLSSYCNKKKIKNISSLIGSLDV
jgi:dihydroorotate dehydrogenase (NAD+) catalytic subunit